MGQKCKNDPKWAKYRKMGFFKKGLSEIFQKINEITYIYICHIMRNDNLKKTGQLRNVRVELGFGTVW